MLVPTYRRPDDLARCLAALAKQTRPADEVVVVRRDGDAETASFLQSHDFALPLRDVVVDVPGQVAALNAGLQQVGADIVAITDDDAAPRPGWLATIERHFERDASVGGVGGRDHVHGDTDSEKRLVGKLRWFGKTVGNHHRGKGRARYVDFLKGANMSYRMSAVGSRRFDLRLLGQGAQVHNDLAFALAIRRSGWRLIYDPEVAVDHYPAQRFDEDQRTERSLRSVEYSAHNETVAILPNLPLRSHLFFWLWSIVVGTRVHPGLVQCARFAMSKTAVRHRFLATLKGRFAARRVLAKSNIESEAQQPNRSPAR